MTKDQVVGAIGAPDQVVGARKRGNNTVETWEYIRIAAAPGPDRIGERYQVEFTDGKLSAFESSGDSKLQFNHRY